MRHGGLLFSFVSSIAVVAVVAVIVVVGACSAVDSSVHTTRWDEAPVAADTATPAGPAVTVPPFIVDPLATDERRTFVDDTKLAMVLIQTGTSWGTGFVVAVQGNKRVVVTNHHVVAPVLGKKGAEGRIRGFFLTSIGDPAGADATVLAADKARDLAILKFDINDSRIKSLRLAGSVEAKRQRVVVVGFPWGNLNAGAENASPSLNVGDTDGDVQRRYGNTFIKVTAGIHPGNSGGPVLNSAGDVIGVATLQEYTKQSLASGVRSNQAIPVADVIAFAKKKKIDLRSSSVVAGAFAPEAVAVDASEARRALAAIDIGGAGGTRIACAVIANGSDVGAWLLCDPLTESQRSIKGTITFAGMTTSTAATLVTHRDGWSLFRAPHAPGVPVAVIARSSTLQELEVVKRVRALPSAGAPMFTDTGIRVSSVRKDRSGTTAVQLLVDPGLDDTSRAGGVYLTAAGRLVGIEADAAPGTNLRAVAPADVAWGVIDGAAATLLTRGHTVRDEALGVAASFPRLAAHIETRYGDGPVGVAWQSVGGGGVCSVELWTTLPEPVEAVLGRPSPLPSTSSRTSRQGSAVARIDVVEGGESWRITDGTSLLRVQNRGKPARCSGQLLRTPSTTEVATLDAWSRALTTHLEKPAATSTTTASVKTPTSTAPKNSDGDDDVPVCGVWSWPKVRSPDRAWVAQLPCGATRRQTLSGRVVITKMVARPSPLHRFEVASWSNVASADDADHATSSYDEIIDDYILTRLADSAVAALGAHTDGRKASRVPIVDGAGDALDDTAGMLQSGTLRDGRRVLALVTMTRGQVVHVATAIVPKTDMKRAQQFVSTFKLLVDTDSGPAIKLEAPPSSSRKRSPAN